LRIITKAAPGKFPKHEAAIKEFEAELFCHDWFFARKWLRDNGIDFAKFPEEATYK